MPDEDTQDQAALSTAPVEVDPDTGAAPEEEPMVYPGMNWFVLRVASNKEDSVRRNAAA